MSKPDWVGLRMEIEGTVIDEIPETMAEAYGVEHIDLDTIIEEMLDQGIEQCPECGTWVESGEIYWDSYRDEILGCEACQ